jgi:hypothetical protein
MTKMPRWCVPIAGCPRPDSVTKFQLLEVRWPIGPFANRATPCQLLQVGELHVGHYRPARTGRAQAGRVTARSSISSEGRP